MLEENKVYTEKELLNLGFEWEHDGGEDYLVKLDDPEDLWGSPFWYSVEVKGGFRIERAG